MALNEISEEYTDTTNENILPIDYKLISDISDRHDCEYKNEERYIILTTSKELNKINIERWNYNRPPDMLRIPDICKSYRGKKMVTGIIYLTKEYDSKNMKMRYYCYDGLHRLKALEELDNDIEVIIDIFIEPNECLVINEFKKINKSNPVPELYIESMDKRENNKLEIIKEVVEYYYNRYNKFKFFSSSSNPRRPHENRDRMMRKLCELLNDNPYEETFNKLSYDKWIKFLELKNELFKGLVKEAKMNNNQLNKCKKSDMFLFIYSDWHKKKNKTILQDLNI
jgi:hypothetical protein